MGFGALFLGFMFLYDFQIGLRPSESEGVYALLDIFPDAIGWILLFVGLNILSKRFDSFRFLRNSTVFFFVLSLFSLVKESFLFSVFYFQDALYAQSGTQIFVGECLDFCEHLLTLGFIYLLFQKTAPLCRKYGEDKLSRSHELVPRIALVEGALFVTAFLLRILPLPRGILPYANVVSRLDFLFWVFLIWYGTITLFRSLRRISD